MAHLLILMVKTFGSGGEPVSDLDGEKDFSASLMSRLKRTHVESVPTVPAGIEVLRPTLVPSGLEETDLEPYNRAYTLLKYFGYSISSKAHWPKRFGKTGWDDSVQADKHYIPSWMKDTPPTTVVQNPLAEAHVQLSVRTINLEWKRRAGANEEERELLDYLDEHEDELYLPDAIMDCVGDPRTHEPEEFRDILRLQYRCDELKTQISHLSIKIKPDKKTGDEANDFEVHDLFNGDWEEIRHSIESTSPNNSRFLLTTSVAVLSLATTLFSDRPPLVPA
jgi:hypothetical protein